MRHRVAGRRLSRKSEHRLAMRRNLAASLIEHETISTTIEKAKEVKSFVEKLITLAKKGTLASRRRAISLLGNRDIVEYDNGKAVKKGTVVGKLFSELGSRYIDRPGGYTRIIRLSLRRLGDNGQLVLLQLVSEDERKKKGATARTKRSLKKAERAARAEETADAREVVEEQDVADQQKISSAHTASKDEHLSESEEALQTEGETKNSVEQDE
jgi:large subunit ribosomal protein L17